MSPKRSRVSYLLTSCCLACVFDPQSHLAEGHGLQGLRETYPLQIDSRRGRLAMMRISPHVFLTELAVWLCCFDGLVMERALKTHSFCGTYIECSIALLWCFPTALAPAAPAQIPGRRKHGLTGAGGGLQHGLDAGDHRDGGRGIRSLALGCHYDDHISFGEILQHDRWRASQ